MDDSENNNNEKLQELSIIIGDRIRSVDRVWWYGLLVALFLCIPLYFVLRASFATVIVSNHKFPAIIYEEETKVPLEVTEKKIFKLGGNAYAGFIKVKNSANFEWGVPNQSYTAKFFTTGGTEVARISQSTFILPGSEKIIVFSRFTADREPTQVTVELGPTQFVHKPTNKPDPNLMVDRRDLEIADSKLIVHASVKNNTPFTIKRINLPVLLYDNKNQIIGANFTNIDEVLYGETRSFEFRWPDNPHAARAEILPEVNIFDFDIYKLPPGTSQFDPELSE